MTKNTMKQYAMLMIVFGAILIAGGYQAMNPVLAVSAHDDTNDMHSMLAITTFEVEPTYTSCDQLNMDLLMSYDNNPQNGVIGASELAKAIQDCSDGTLSDDGLDQINFAATNSCPIDIPPDPARIDDATDTLTTDKSTYKAGDRVRMTATGTNIGDENWHGFIKFYSTDPSGYTREVYDYELDVAAGATESRDGLMTLPTSAIIGTWTIQSKWIDDEGTVHAMSTIDLGTETIWGIDIYMLGAIGALLGILLLIGGLIARKR